MSAEAGDARNSKPRAVSTAKVFAPSTEGTSRTPSVCPVCGTAAATRQTQLVPDVEAFPGHIACDSASRSEVVVPLFKGDTLVGVFDIDSPVLDRFDADDQRGLEALAAAFLDTLA